MLPLVKNLLPRPYDNSKSMDYFLWSTATTNTSTCDFETPLKGFRSSLNCLCSNWRDHQVLDMNLDNPKCVWRQTLLDLMRMWLDSHTQHKQQHENVARFFLLYLRQNIKPYTSYGLGLSGKFCRKIFSTSFDQSSLIFDRSFLAES